MKGKYTPFPVIVGSGIACLIGIGVYYLKLWPFALNKKENSNQQLSEDFRKKSNVVEEAKVFLNSVQQNNSSVEIIPYNNNYSKDTTYKVGDNTNIHGGVHNSTVIINNMGADRQTELENRVRKLEDENTNLKQVIQKLLVTLTQLAMNQVANKVAVARTNEDVGYLLKRDEQKHRSEIITNKEFENKVTEEQVKEAQEILSNFQDSRLLEYDRLMMEVNKMGINLQGDSADEDSSY